MKKRGQFSLEFLLTYGWVFFIILAGVAVIYSTGIFSFSDFLPQKCEFLGQIRCVEAQVKSNSPGVGSFNISVANDFGVNLVIYNATLSDGFGTTCFGGTGTQNYISWPIDSSVVVNVSSCTGLKLNKGQRFEGDVILTYYRDNAWCTPPTNCLYTSVGQLVVKIS